MTAELQATTREATLTLLLKQGKTSAANLAAFMEISVQAMRRHLRSLESDGLVESSSISEGPGRPSNLWKLTSEGHNCFNNGNGSEKFALDLLASIEANTSKENMAEILHIQTLEKAINYRAQIGNGDLNVRLQKLIELRKKEGYLAELQLSSDGSSWYLNAFHCSISSIAEEYPIVCDQELQLIRNIFPECDVQRVQWRLESGHGCGFQVNPTKADG